MVGFTCKGLGYTAFHRYGIGVRVHTLHVDLPGLNLVLSLAVIQLVGLTRLSQAVLVNIVLPYLILPFDQLRWCLAGIKR